MLYSAQTSSSCLIQLRLLTQRLFTLMSKTVGKWRLLFAVQPVSIRSLLQTEQRHRHCTQSNISCCCQAGQLESGGPTVPVSCDFAFYTSSGRQLNNSMPRFPTRTRQGQRGPLVVLEKFYFFLFFSISYNNTDVTEYIVLQTQSTPPPPPPPWLLLP